MPFYDDFDLSTVDVLLISQYVPTFALRSSSEVGGPGASLQSYMHGGQFGDQRLVYQKQWNIICTIHSTPVMCLLTLARMYIAVSSISP